MNKVSVVIISFNEEKNIKDCLENIRWCDEIIIVDCGSTDKTLEIAKQYNVKIYKKRWMGYGRQKNYALSKATNEWILSLDADERIEPALSKEIKEILPTTIYDGFLVPFKHLALTHWIRRCGWYPEYHLRLFRKKKGKFTEDIVHERIIVQGKVGKLKNAIIHSTIISINGRVSKINSRTSLAALKGAKTYHVLKFLFLPLLRFFYHFILKLGFLDGSYGIYVSYDRAFYEFLRQAKLWERQITSRERVKLTEFEKYRST
jgi:glycosyltransferase involved in cell wall biosynthesis